MFACLLAAEKETTARAGDPCNAAQHCRCHPVGLQQKLAATHAVNHIGPRPLPADRMVVVDAATVAMLQTYTSRPTYIKDTTRRNTTPSAVAAAADAAAARERLFLSVRTSLATTTTTATKKSLYACKKNKM